MRASKTRRVLACAVAFCAASCAAKPKLAAPRPHSPVPAVLVVEDGHLALRQNEFVELHAFLAAAARSQDEAADGAYVRVFERDEDDTILAATTRGLAECATLECAIGVLEPHGLGTSFAKALPSFTAQEWDARAAIGWTAVERAHAAFGERAEGVVASVAKDLAVTWTRPAAPVDIVAIAPPLGRSALLTPLLAARGPCFAQRAREAEDVENARLVDCIAVRALLAGSSPHQAVLGERFWTVLVVHAVAATVTGLEPRHLSADRRALTVAAPALLDVITQHWHGGPLNVEEWTERARTSALPDNASR